MASPQTSRSPTRATTPTTSCERIAQTGGEVVIPPKRNRSFKRPYDADLYKERNVIERFFNKLKQFRRVATRYDKLLANFMGFVKLAAIAMWLK
jgi:putative transposase